MRVYHLNHGANQWARREVFATVPPGVTHVFNFSFVKVRQLVLLGLGAKAEFVDQFQGIAQAVSAGESVTNFTKDFADFLFNSVCADCSFLEAVQIGKKIKAEKLNKIAACQGVVVVKAGLFPEDVINVSESLFEHLRFQVFTLFDC
nr:hypothetical protein [Marinobacter sp. LV10MA510-1]